MRRVRGRPERWSTKETTLERRGRDETPETVKFTVKEILRKGPVRLTSQGRVPRTEKMS